MVKRARQFGVLLAILLAVFWLIDVFVVRNSPAEAGLGEFNTGDATSGDEGPRLGALKVFGMMLRIEQSNLLATRSYV